MSIYYLGLKKDAIKYNNYFKSAVVLTGKKNKSDISYEEEKNKKIDYNNMVNFKKISKFYDEMILKIQAKNKNAQFMLYNQAAVEYMKNVENIVCYNDVNLIKTLNNKPMCRELLKREVKLLNYKTLSAEEISFENINLMFKNKFEKYVVQQPFGFAGVGTLLLDCNTNITKNLKANEVYSVSGYVENADSINNTFIISNNYIHIFDGSYQKIVKNKELNYDGWDFEAYKNLNSSIKKKIYQQTIKIAKKLQSLGYRGVGGVDYLLKGKNIYFMEINPRFQSSSQELDKILKENAKPSIFELNYMAFYDEKAFIATCKSI